MRVLRYLIISLIVIFILGIIGFFAAREGFLLLGSRRLEDSLEVLSLYSQRNAAESECQRLADDDSAAADGIVYQLRFTDSKNYLLEAICPLNQSSPIELGTNSLPPYVQKSPGRSGVVWSEDASAGVEVVVFSQLAEFLDEHLEAGSPLWISKSRNVVVEDGVIDRNASYLPDNPGPVATCEGYGYTCCDAIAESGSGEQLVGLQNCPENCYARCIAKPVVLSFNTNPFFDVKTRVVSIQAGKPLEFAYVASGKGGQGLSAEIDFGDGETAEIQGAEGETTHTYDCNRSVCTYTATIKVEDENGLESTETSVNRITVEVAGQ